MQNTPQIQQAITIVNQLLPLVEQAERKLKSARNWGIFDMLGGGFIVDLIKHSKLNSASNTMTEVSMLLQQLQQTLGGIQIPVDYRMNIGGFATFADFFFDGVLADTYMTSKIFSSIEQVRTLKEKLYTLRNYLTRMKAQNSNTGLKL